MRSLLLLAALALLAIPATAPAATPMDARSFVDSQGVNVHLYYDDTAYGNFAMVKQRLQELGIRHVRDGFDPSHRQWVYDRINSLGAAGIKTTMISCRIVPGGWDNLDADVSDAKNKIRGSLDALEGTNEPDLTGYSDWAQQTRDCQYWLNRLAKDGTYGDPLNVPVYGMSATGDKYKVVGDISDRAAGGNIHPYPGNQRPSGPDWFPFSSQMAGVRTYEFGGRAVPVIASETGYHNALNTSSGHRPVSERASGIYIPRLLLEYARAGVERTFLYELVNQKPNDALTDDQQHFGLFRNDWSYKPAATAIRNMNLLLDGPTGPRTPLDYSISNTADPDGDGPMGAVKDMLLQGGDGAYWLALWQDSKVWDNINGGDIEHGEIRPKIVLPRPMKIEIYEPNQGTHVIASGTAQSFNTGVKMNVRLVRLSDG